MTTLRAALGAATMAACLFSSAAGAQSRETFEITAPDGYTIAADLALPELTEDAVPVVLLISGSGPQNRDAELFDGQYAPHSAWRDAFVTAGIGVLTFDEAGQGESGGSWPDMGIRDLAEIAERLVVRARNHHRIDPERVFVLGHSEGGIVASILSAGDPELAGVLLLASPGRPASEIMEYQLRINAAERADSPENQAEIHEMMRARWMAAIERTATLREAFDLDPLELASGIQSPVAILQGWADWQIEPDQAWLLAQAIRSAGGEVDVHIFTDVNHLLIRDPDGPTAYEHLPDYSLDRQVLRTGVDWILSHSF